MSPRKPSYVPSPTVSQQALPRLVAIAEVMAGAKTVSQAARELGLSRNHFQTILHRAQSSLIESVSPKPGGRPSRAKEVVSLQGQLRKLQRQNVRLQRQVEATHQLLAVAGGLLKGRLRPGGQARQRKRRSNGEPPADSEPEGRRARLLEAARQMQGLGLRQGQVAGLVGVDAATLRRWRRGLGHPVQRQRGRRHSAQADAQAEQLVRRLHGLVGANALAHSVPGLSRRAAAELKVRVLTQMEQERKGELVRVRISTPGVLRGIDAMHFTTTEGPLYALISADGAIPYRTMLVCGTHYDAHLVAQAIALDIQHNGAPLVLRLDRASCHAAPQVTQLLDRHGVLVLQGPAHYPRFYGQLERQNREHRLWMGPTQDLSREDSQRCLREMLRCVNALWRRCTLQWQTAEERWNQRAPIIVDRAALREEVRARAARIACNSRSRGTSADLAERIAIQRTLEHRGYLQQQVGGWC